MSGSSSNSTSTVSSSGTYNNVDIDDDNDNIIKDEDENDDEYDYLNELIEQFEVGNPYSGSETKKETQTLIKNKKRKIIKKCVFPKMILFVCGVITLVSVAALVIAGIFIEIGDKQKIDETNPEEINFENYNEIFGSDELIEKYLSKYKLRKSTEYIDYVRNRIDIYEFCRVIKEDFHKNKQLSIKNMNGFFNPILNNLLSIEIAEIEYQEIDTLISKKFPILIDYYESCLIGINRNLSISYIDDKLDGYYFSGNLKKYFEEELKNLNNDGINLALFFNFEFQLVDKYVILSSPNMFINFFDNKNNQIIFNLVYKDNNKETIEQFEKKINSIISDVIQSYSFRNDQLVEDIIEFERLILINSCLNETLSYNTNTSSNKLNIELINKLDNIPSILGHYINYKNDDETDLAFFYSNKKYLNYIQKYESDNNVEKKLTFFKDYYRSKLYLNSILDLGKKHNNIIKNYNNLFYNLVLKNDFSFEDYGTYTNSDNKYCKNFLIHNLKLMKDYYLNFIIKERNELMNSNYTNYFQEIFEKTKKNLIEYLYYKKIVHNDDNNLVFFLNQTQLTFENYFYDYYNSIYYVNEFLKKSTPSKNFNDNDDSTTITFISSESNIENLYFCNYINYKNYGLYLNYNPYNLNYNFENNNIYIPPLVANYFMKEDNSILFNTFELSNLLLDKMLSILRNFDESIYENFNLNKLYNSNYVFNFQEETLYLNETIDSFYFEISVKISNEILNGEDESVKKFQLKYLKDHNLEFYDLLELIQLNSFCDINDGIF